VQRSGRTGDRAGTQSGERDSTFDFCRLIDFEGRLCTALGGLPQAPGSAIRWKWQAGVRRLAELATSCLSGALGGDDRGRRRTADSHGPPVLHTFHMGYYVLEYALVDDYLARRAAFREEHLALARDAHRHRDLILAGALAEPADRAVLVWRTDDRSLIERFIDADPYVRNGLVTSWTIRPWTVVIGEEAGQR